MTPATERKRQQLLHFIRVKLEPESTVQGVVGVGSIATGTATGDSDIDAIVLLDPYDLYVVPAEAIWREQDDSFHSIFSMDKDLLTNGLQIDFTRVDFNVWRNSSFVLSEPMKSEIANGWVAFDRAGEVERLITAMTCFDDATRTLRIDESIIWLDLLLGEGEPERVWHALGPMVAHDRLNAAYEYFVQMLFAYNKKWRPWKTREMTSLLQLKWLPQHFDTHGLVSLVAGSQDYAGYSTRAESLSLLFKEVLTQLTVDGTYGARPVSEAFIRNHDEPGRAWNMEDWMRKHRER